MYFGGQQTFPKYKRYSYVRPLNTRSMVSLSFIGLWHGRGGIYLIHIVTILHILHLKNTM